MTAQGPGVWGRLAAAAVASLFAIAAAAAPPAAADPYTQLSLRLQVARNIVSGERFAVIASGTAPTGYVLWVFVDPRGEGCPPDPDLRAPRSVMIVSGVPVDETFSVSGLYRAERVGPQSFCAFLKRFPGDASVAAGEQRDVRAPALRQAAAVHTVEIALRRHKFAERVVQALQTNCARRGRAEFACKFSAEFEGYKLTGKGRVRRLHHHLRYRFRVQAQGERFVLTDRNEGRLPGG